MDESSRNGLAVDPDSEQVRRLAERWSTLISEFTGGNPAIEQGLRTLYQQESGSGHPHMDPRMPEYIASIGRAMAANTTVE